MSFAFLPHQSRTWLCQVDGALVQPLVEAPGDEDAIWRFSEDGKEFGNIDQAGKRIGHYRLLEQAPWIEVVKPPLTLPKTARANDLVIYQGFMIVAGHAKSGEALWTRDPLSDRQWTAIPLPPGVGKRGKSVDAVYVRDGKLVAIDNMLIPKWILVYDLEPEVNVTNVQVVPLKAHTTYETVNCTAVGDRFYALRSIGINHGNVSIYISLLDKQTLKEQVRWSWVETENRRSEFFDIDSVFDEEDVDYDKPLAFIEQTGSLITSSVVKLVEPEDGDTPIGTRAIFGAIRDMKFCRNYLTLAAGEFGLHIALVPEVLASSASQTLPPFKEFSLQRLTRAHRLERAFGDSDGLYVVGECSLGFQNYEWVSADALKDLVQL